MGKSRYFFAMSGCILLIGSLALATKGLNFGIDFESGTRVTATLEKPAPRRGRAQRDLAAQPRATRRSSRARRKARTRSRSARRSSGRAESSACRTRSRRTSRSRRRASRARASVRPSAETVAKSAIYAIVFSLLAIMGYIAFRFEFKFAVPVLIAVFHDILITTGVYSLLGRDVTTSTVAALLTILGYSLYDTVIVFDRVRENTPRMPRAAFSQIVNRSMSEVLTRSLATSFCTMLPVVALLIFGGQTLQDFAFALLVGIASGAYSSIFIASPVLTESKEREPAYRQRRRRIIDEFGFVPAYAVAPAGAARAAGEAGRRLRRDSRGSAGRRGRRATMSRAPPRSRTTAPGPKPRSRSRRQASETAPARLPPAGDTFIDQRRPSPSARSARSARAAASTGGTAKPCQCSFGVMTGIAVWHFAVFVPERFVGGIVGAFIAAWLGAVDLRPDHAPRNRRRPHARRHRHDVRGRGRRRDRLGDLLDDRLASRRGANRRKIGIPRADPSGFRLRRRLACARDRSRTAAARCARRRACMARWSIDPAPYRQTLRLLTGGRPQRGGRVGAGAAGPWPIRRRPRRFLAADERHDPFAFEGMARRRGQDARPHPCRRSRSRCTATTTSTASARRRC